MWLCDQADALKRNQILLDNFFETTQFIIKNILFGYPNELINSISNIAVNEYISK